MATQVLTFAEETVTIFGIATIRKQDRRTAPGAETGTFSVTLLLNTGGQLTEEFDSISARDARLAEIIAIYNT